MNALSILHVEFDDLDKDVSGEHDGDGRPGCTHTARFGNLDDCHPTAVRALHLNVQLFVAHHKDHVYYIFK